MLRDLRGAEAADVLEISSADLHDGSGWEGRNASDIREAQSTARSAKAHQLWDESVGKVVRTSDLTKRTKDKNQLSYLAQQAQEAQRSVLATKAKGAKARGVTRSKYGW
jgi:hypothetical protein